MPLSAYRDYVGVAKITQAGSTTTAYASGVTSVAVNVLGTPPSGATLSVIFLDGPNTETKAISAVTGSGPYTLTVSATANAHPINCFVFFQTTASIGPTEFIPMKTFDPSDKYPAIYDDTPRGLMGVKFSATQGIRNSEWSFGGDMFADSFGYITKGILGAEDFTSATPNTHAQGMANTNSNALGQVGQPDYYAYYVYDAVNTRVVVGKLTEVGIKLDPKANVNYTGKLLARASGVVSNPTTSYSAITPIPSWRASATINSVVYQTPLTAEYTFTRTEPEAIPTLQGNQDPYDIFVGALEITGKYSFVKENDTIYNLFAAGTDIPISLAMTQGTGSTEIGLTIQTSAVNLDSEDPKLQGKAYNTEDLAFTAMMNTTDVTTAGGGADANGKVTLLNTIANIY